MFAKSLAGLEMWALDGSRTDSQNIALTHHDSYHLQHHDARKPFLRLFLHQEATLSLDTQRTDPKRPKTPHVSAAFLANDNTVERSKKMPSTFQVWCKYI